MGLDGERQVGADQFQPAQLVPGRHSSGFTQYRSGVEASRIGLGRQGLWRHPYPEGQKLRG